jgi:signal peptidase I
MSVKQVLLLDAWGWLKTIVVAIAFALIISRFIIVNAEVPTASMEGTIRTNDRIVAFRLSYAFSEPEPMHIIVFRGPDDPGTLYVKRIVAGPGDEVEIRDGYVFVNGSATPQYDGFMQGVRRGNFGPVTVPEGEFFVLGDYRSNSVDSRHWQNTFVPSEKILGRVVFRYFPGFQILTGR